MQSTKAMQERMRRERCKSAIENLKELLISTSQLDVDQAAEMEEAPFCETTVNYLHRVQREARSIHNPEIEDGKFTAGLAQAAKEVMNILAVTPSADGELNQRLMAHLGHPNTFSTVSILNAEDQMNSSSQTSMSRLSDEKSKKKPSNATSIDARIISSSSDEEIDVEN